MGIPFINITPVKILNQIDLWDGAQLHLKIPKKGFIYCQQDFPRKLSGASKCQCDSFVEVYCIFMYISLDPHIVLQPA